MCNKKGAILPLSIRFYRWLTNVSNVLTQWVAHVLRPCLLLAAW